MKRLVIAGVVVGLSMMLGVTPTSAAFTCPPDTPGAGRTDVSSPAECMLDPGDQPDDVFPVVQNAINVILGVLGVVAVGVIILGGFYFLTSQGDAAKVTKGKNTILYGVVGLVIALLAFAIVNFVLGKLFTSSAATPDETETPDVSLIEEVNA